MEALTFMSAASDLEPINRVSDQEYLQCVSSFVAKHKFKKLSLKKPANATFKMCDLEDTIYSERPDVVNGWGSFYLPDIVDMQVVGVVESTSCPGDQLVLMTCVDKKLYGYDGQQLHVVASDLNQVIRDTKIDYPASESYYNGEAFKNMTEADWRKVKMGPVGKRLDEDFNRMVQQHKNSFMKSLTSSAHT